MLSSGDQSEAAAKMKALEQSMLKDSFTAGGDALRSASQISGGSKGGGKGAGGGKPKDDRMALIRQQENIAACQNKVRGPSIFLSINDCMCEGQTSLSSSMIV